MEDNGFADQKPSDPMDLNPSSSRTTLGSEMESPVHIPPYHCMSKLGCGTGADVYRLQRPGVPSMYTGRSPWAMKQVQRDFRDCSERLKREAEILRSLNHPNIVKFKGTAWSVDRKLCLFMEECDYSLDKLMELRSEYGMTMLHSHEIMTIAISIIRALSYLHNEKKLLHGDIKSGNVLIKGEVSQVKLCDFGVSIFLKDDLSGPLDPNAKYIGTEPWKSPEVLDWNDGIITDKADIFSFGLVIWETLTLKAPHVDLLLDNSRCTNDDSFSSNGTNDSSCSPYYKALGTSPPLPNIQYCTRYSTPIQLFLWCTKGDYRLRPSASALTDVFEDIAITS